MMSGIIQIARRLTGQGKGLLAAEQSLASIERRFASFGLASTEVSRRAYREMLFMTPEVEKSLGGVILSEEALGQKAMSGEPFAEILNRRGIVPGVSFSTPPPDDADPLNADETAERLIRYKRGGAYFVKVPVFITFAGAFDDNGEMALEGHARRTTAFVRASQDADVMPLIDLQLRDHSRGDMLLSAQHIEPIFDHLFEQMSREEILYDGLLLRLRMIHDPDAVSMDDVNAIVDATLACLMQNVPRLVPAILFASGGNDADLAIACLQAIEERAGNAPWQLSFASGRALQDSALAIWARNPRAIELAQQAFLGRARSFSEAVRRRNLT
jgi:fructose-bisphosphate aldolase class I